jgi:hypothetical protein
MNRATLIVIVMVIAAITIHVTAVAYRDRHPKPASQLADAITRVAAGWTTLGLVAIAGTISYNHLYTLAAHNGQTAWRASAFPLSVDGVEVVASLVLLNARRRSRPAGWLPWFAFAIAGVASLIANVAVAPNHPVARIIAAWPAVALVIASKMFFGLLDQPTHTPTQPQHNALATATVGPDPTTDLATATTTDLADVPLPAARWPTPEAQELSTPPTARPAPAASTPADTTAPIDELPTATTVGGSSADAGEQPNQPSTVTVRLPVDLMRRIPVQQDRYDNWRRIWQHLQQPGSEQRVIAQDNERSLRTIQFIRSAGDAGFLNSPIPPAQRMLTLNNHPDEASAPTRPGAPPPATTPGDEARPVQQPQEQLADATAELLAGIDQVLQDAAATRP